MMKIEKVSDLKELKDDNYYWIKVKTVWRIRRANISNGDLFLGEVPYAHIRRRFPHAQIAGPMPLPDQFND